MWNINISVYLCLFVCLFVCLSVHSHISKTTYPNITKFSVFPPDSVRASLWRQCDTLCISRFAITSFFHIIQRMGKIRDDAYIFWSSSPGGGTGSEVCRLRLHLVVSLGSADYNKAEITFSSAWTRRSSALHRPRSASRACSLRITCLIVLSMSLTWFAFSTKRRFIWHSSTTKRVASCWLWRDDVDAATLLLSGRVRD